MSLSFFSKDADVRMGVFITAMDTERFEQAIALRDAGQVEQALEDFASLVISTTDLQEKASLVLNEATCLTIMRRFDEARERQEEALRISPTVEIRASADFGTAAIDALEGRDAEALARFDKLLHDYGQLLSAPGHRDVYYETQMRRGSLLVGAGRFREARAVLEECLTFPLGESDERFVLFNIGACYTNLRERELAKKFLQQALERGLQCSDAVSAHYYLGTIYSGERAYAKALMEFEWCLAHVEEGQIPKKHVCEWLARTARSLGMKGEAERYDKLGKA
jgi:tetratricopeptide (TPR) repeat protein